MNSFILYEHEKKAHKKGELVYLLRPVHKGEECPYPPGSKIKIINDFFEPYEYYIDILGARMEKLSELGMAYAINSGIMTELSRGGDPENIKFPDDFEEWSEGKREEWIKSTARSIYFAQCHDHNALCTEMKRVWNLNFPDHDFDKSWCWVYVVGEESFS